MTFHVPNPLRVRTGPMASDDGIGNAGAFEIRILSKTFFVIASDAHGWEHVSVSTKNRCPSWDDMTRIKGIFWDENDTVIQFHPPKSEYVNNHPYCLHLWKPMEHDIPLPPSILVGVK